MSEFISCEKEGVYVLNFFGSPEKNTAVLFIRRMSVVISIENMKCPGKKKKMSFESHTTVTFEMPHKPHFSTLFLHAKTCTIHAPGRLPITRQAECECCNARAREKNTVIVISTIFRR